MRQKEGKNNRVVDRESREEKGSNERWRSTGEMQRKWRGVPPGWGFRRPRLVERRVGRA